MAHRGKLLLELQVIGRFEVGRRASQGLDMIGFHGTGRQASLGEQAVAHFVVGALAQPPGAQRPGQEDKNRKGYPPPAAGIRTFCVLPVLHRVGSFIRIFS